jgi:hypothetical protein
VLDSEGPCPKGYSDISRCRVQGHWKRTTRVLRLAFARHCWRAASGFSSVGTATARAPSYLPRRRQTTVDTAQAFYVCGARQIAPRAYTLSPVDSRPPRTGRRRAPHISPRAARLASQIQRRVHHGARAQVRCAVRREIQHLGWRTRQGTSVVRRGLSGRLSFEGCVKAAESGVRWQHVPPDWRRQSTTRAALLGRSVDSHDTSDKPAGHPRKLRQSRALAQCHA